MGFSPPEAGRVVNFSYLWTHEAAQGRDEGAKRRPCLIGAVKPREGGPPTVLVFPITHTPPDDPARAVEIPQGLKRKLGLDAERSWVICDQVNKFTWPGCDLYPAPRGQECFGQVPQGFFRDVHKTAMALCSQSRVITINRDTAPPRPQGF
jgi:hypothetical protein